jgi:hemerythrin-like domain-containing protein
MHANRPEAAMSKSANALEVLRGDHREVQDLFHRFERANEQEQETLCREMIDALRTHTRIEEEVFYPYLRDATDRADLVEEASVEHTAAKQLLDDLQSGRDGLHRHAVVKVLSEYIGHHIREEEDKIFPLVEKTGVDLEALGQELLDHKHGRRPPEPRGAAPKAADRGAGRPAGGSARPSHSREDDQQFLEEHHDQLSRSSQRAKWIHAPGEREDHAGQTLATRNPEVIKAWADERKARPTTTKNGDPENPRVLRFDFPDYGGKSLQPVSWEAWIRVFEERQLVFLFQQHMKAGNQSNFFRLDSPEREDG